MNLLKQSLVRTVTRVKIIFAICRTPNDGWNSDHLNSQLNHGDLGVVDDGGMSSPSPLSSLSRFGSAWWEQVVANCLRVPHFMLLLQARVSWATRLILCMPVCMRRSVYLPSINISNFTTTRSLECDENRLQPNSSDSVCHIHPLNPCHYHSHRRRRKTMFIL